MFEFSTLRKLVRKPIMVKDIFMRSDTLNRLGLYLSATLFLGVASFALVGFLLLATSPRDIGAFGVTIWFLALFALSTAAITLIRYNWKRRSIPEAQERLRLFQKSLRSAVIISLFITVGLAMQSLRMLSMGDIILFLLTLGIIELYFRTKRHD